MDARSLQKSLYVCCVQAVRSSVSCTRSKAECSDEEISFCCGACCYWPYLTKVECVHRRCNWDGGTLWLWCYRSCSLPIVVYVIKSGVWSKSHAKRSNGTPQNMYVMMILKRYYDRRLWIGLCRQRIGTKCTISIYEYYSASWKVTLRRKTVDWLGEAL